MDAAAHARPHVHPETPDTPPPRRLARRYSWVTTLLVLAAVILVLGPIAWPLWQAERTRWETAHADNLLLAGDNEAFRAAAFELTSRNADNAAVWLWAGRTFWQLGDNATALTHLERAIDLDPDLIEARHLHGDALLRSGRFAEAVASARQAVERLSALGHVAQANGLNSLAYAQAVGNLELDEALKHADAAIQLDMRRSAYLDTRGFVLFRLSRQAAAAGKAAQAESQLTEALRELNAAVELAQREAEEDLEQVEAAARRMSDARMLDPLRAQVKRSLAVLHYHRGLALAAGGKAPEAEADFAKVRELGFTPDEKLF